MLDVLLVIFTVLAFLLLFLSKVMQDVEEPFWSPVLAFIGMFLFFLLAFGVENIEIPWQMYNVSSGQIETGVHVYTNDWELIRFYLGMAVVSLFVMLLEIFQGFKRIAEKSGKVKFRGRDNF